jgi:hypothetical protein
MNNNDYLQRNNINQEHIKILQNNDSPYIYKYKSKISLRDIKN